MDSGGTDTWDVGDRLSRETRAGLLLEAFSDDPNDPGTLSNAQVLIPSHGDPDPAALGGAWKSVFLMCAPRNSDKWPNLANSADSSSEPHNSK